MEQTNNNLLFETIARVSGLNSTIRLPTLREIGKALESQPSWPYVMNNPELFKLRQELDEVSRTYASVTDLRWAMERVFLCFIGILVQGRAESLIYKYQDGNVLLLRHDLVEHKGEVHHVWYIANCINGNMMERYEYYDCLNRNIFDALCVRIQRSDIPATSFGWSDRTVMLEENMGVK